MASKNALITILTLPSVACENGSTVKSHLYFLITAVISLAIYFYIDWVISPSSTLLVKMLPISVIKFPTLIPMP